jgi:hypothetical protein
LSTAIEIIKWVKKIAVAQAKVTHILRPGKVSEKTPKGVIPPSLCEISQNASRNFFLSFGTCPIQIPTGTMLLDFDYPIGQEELVSCSSDYSTRWLAIK